MRVLAVIPARYASTRFPGKPLADVAGRSLIERCWRAAIRATGPEGPLSHVVIATDDRRIFEHAAGFGAEVWMTRDDHPSGTDRLLELATRLPGYDAYVNLQGDEPYVSVAQMRLLVGALTTAQISTLVTPIVRAHELHNPNVVKAVLGTEGRALYFSRQAVPYLRDVADSNAWVAQHTYYRHLGVYGFTAEAIERIRKLAPSPLELVERLEQLRWLEAGLHIRAEVTDHTSPAVDTPEDLARLREAIDRGEFTAD